MEFQPLLNWIGGLATLAITAWVGLTWNKQEALKSEADKLRQDLNDFKLKVAETHPTDDDMREIKATLLRIETKLDLKADK